MLGALLTPLVDCPGIYRSQSVGLAWLALCSAACAWVIVFPGARPGPAPAVPGGTWIALGWTGLVFAALAGLPMVTDVGSARETITLLLSLPVLALAWRCERADPAAEAHWTRATLTLALAVAGGIALLSLFGSPERWRLNGLWAGSLGNPNTAGACAAILLPWAIATLLRPSDRPSLSIAATSSLLLLLWGAGSRAAMLAAVAGAAFAGWGTLHGQTAISGARMRLGAALGGFLLLALVASGIDPVLVVPSAHLQRNQSIAVRTHVLFDTLRLIGDHPFTGVGPGQFAARFPPYRDPVEHAISGELTAIEDPHNAWLGRVADGGVTAGAALLLLAFGLLRALRFAIESCAPASMERGAVGVLVAALVAGCGTDVLLRPGLVPWLALGVGLLPCAPNPTVPSSAWQRAERALSALFVVALLWLSWQAGWSRALAGAAAARGLTATAADGPAAALPMFDAAVAQAPDWPEALALRAQTHDRLGAAPAAIADRTAALCLRPFDPALLNDRGISRAMSGDRSGAEADLRAAVRIAPALRRGWFNLATLLLGENRREDALDAIGRAFPTTEPGESAYRAAIAVVGEQQGAPSLRWLALACRLNPRLARAAMQERAFADFRDQPAFAAALKGE